MTSSKQTYCEHIRVNSKLSGMFGKRDEKVQLVGSCLVKRKACDENIKKQDQFGSFSNK